MASRQTTDITSSSGFDYVSGEAQFASQAQQKDIHLDAETISSTSQIPQMVAVQNHSATS